MQILYSRTHAPFMDIAGAVTIGSADANYLVIDGAASGSAPTVTAFGVDTSVPIQMLPKGIFGAFAIGPIDGFDHIESFHSGPAYGGSPATPLDFVMQNRLPSNGWCGQTITSASSDGTWPFLEFLKARGSLTSPTALTSTSEFYAGGDIIGEVAAIGHDANDYRVSSLIDFRSFGATGKAGQIEFTIADNGGSFSQANPEFRFNDDQLLLRTSGDVPLDIFRSATNITLYGKIKNGSSTGAGAWRSYNDADRFFEFGEGGSGRSDLLTNCGYFYSSAGGITIVADGSNDIRFASAGVASANQTMVIKTDGKVGIGVTGPACILDIFQSNSGATTFGKIKNDSTTGATAWRVYNDGNRTFELGEGGSGRSDLLTNCGYLYSSAGGITIVADGSNDIRFTNGGVSSGNQTMVIKSGGNVGIGVSGPTAVLHLKAGTTVASTAPMKFTTGSNMTSAEAGSMEYNNTFHLTNSDATRRHVVLAPNTTKITAAAPYANDGYVVVNIGGTDFKVMTTA